MITDSIPKRKNENEEYLRSDLLRTIPLPHPEAARDHAQLLKEALASDNRKDVQSACKLLVAQLSNFYSVKAPPIKILSVRPRTITERGSYELFGDYEPETTQIRLWMRTAVHKKPTSYGTLLSTLCHEFCHHLDIVSLDLPNSIHTRGFYERAGLIYHQIQNTPVRNIVWVKQPRGTYRVNWAKTMSAPRDSNATQSGD